MSAQGLAAPDFAEIARRLKAGTIVPFFGAGASMACGMPSARELAELIAKVGKYPDQSASDLAHVASYCVQTGADEIALKDAIREALGSRPASPGRLHRLIASSACQETRLLVTTNYDTLIEDALAHRSPWVVVDRGEPGQVWCRNPASGNWDAVESKELRRAIGDSQRPIVLKLHGHFERHDRDQDSFLITEEGYVDFLGRGDGMQIPPALALSISQRSLLFLGYGLRDWNVRVLLHKLASRPSLRGGRVQSWAVVREPSMADRALWEARNVRMHDIDLEAFVQGLEPHL
jgi:hypothetical protein